LRQIASRDLLGGSREVLIDHRGEIYRLRETRSGKLILNK
jgi:hemin uptake protein HemP